MYYTYISCQLFILDDLLTPPPKKQQQQQQPNPTTAANTVQLPERYICVRVCVVLFEFFCLVESRSKVNKGGMARSDCK